MATHGRRNPNPIPYLPEEIMYKVFLRLPVEDLLRSKKVCKSWLSLISSPDFVKNHLSMSINDPHFTRHHLLLACRLPNSLNFEIMKSCSIYSLLNHDSVNEAVELDCPDRIIGVVGYCNGLICLKSHDNYLFFWNPSTRKSRRIPKIDTILADCMLLNYGFGYDESNDEFKVFAISTFTCERKNKMSVYSSKSDAWRLIGDFSFLSVLSEGYLADGALHWLVSPQRLIGSGSIGSVNFVSVGIETETCREVMLPDCGDCDATIANFGKSLSVFCNMECEDSGADLWVMKKSDGEESWIKLFTIPHMDRIEQDSDIQPICISVKGDIMLHLDKIIVLYNSRDHTFKDMLNNISSEIFGVYTYVESLVSPHL